MDPNAEEIDSSALPDARGVGVLAALVAVGGALGATARAELAAAFPATTGHWAWTTFWINIAGSALLGALVETLHRCGPDNGWRRCVRLGAGTGLIGGFTTYSTFAVEVERLAADRRLDLAAGYAVGSVVLGIAAACAGIAMVAVAWQPRGGNR